MVCRKKTISFLLILFVSILSCYAAVDPNYTKESFHFKYVINPEPTTNMYFCDNPEGTYNGDFSSLPDTIDKETNLEEPLFYFRFFSNENGTWNLTISFTPFESESTGTKLPYSVTVGKTDDSTFSKPYEITNSGLKEQELESLTFGNSADVIYSFTYDLETAFNTGVALDDYEATITIGAYGP